MNTIRTKKTKSSATHRQPLPVWGMAWVGLFLLAFGLPLTAARLMEVPSEAVRLALLEERSVPDEALFVHDPLKRMAANILQTGVAYNDLALVANEAATRPAFSSVKKDLAQEAEHWERKALAVTPADPYGWFQLAHLLYAKDGASAQVAQAWRLSMAAAPYEPRLILPRLQMALALGPALDKTSGQQIPRLIAQAWAYDPTALARFAKAGAFISLVEDVLRDDPQKLKHFHDQLDLL